MVNWIKYVKTKEGKLELYCSECDSQSLIYDYLHHEIICADCSLVVKDNSLMSLEQQYNDALKLQNYRRYNKKKKNRKKS